MEESPNRLWGDGGASRQRRRWVKGYLQTGFVHGRNPLQAMRQMGVVNYCSYLLLMFGTPISLILNPVFWSLTIAYAITRSPTIQQLFPAPLYYAGMAVLLIGNIGLFYQLLISCYREKDWSSVPRMLLAPLWWFFNSTTAYQMMAELPRRKTRQRWHKTAHGHSTVREVAIVT
jgi:hypothetical protein